MGRAGDGGPCRIAQLSISPVYVGGLVNTSSGWELAAPGQGRHGRGRARVAAPRRGSVGSTGRLSTRRDWGAADLLQSGCAACR